VIIPVSHEETTVRRRPWVTFAIMALCTAVLILTDFYGDAETYARWGIIPKYPRAAGLLTHMFVHAGWGHLLGNLLILFLAGPPLEDRWGRPFFAGLYVGAGVFAGGFYTLMTPGSNVPMVGASGAIAALMGAGLVRFWSAKIRFFYFFWFLRVIKGTFWAPAWAILPLWFLSNVIMARLADNLGVVSGVAYWCHVGGFVFGAAFAYGMRHWQVEGRYINPAIESRITVVSNAVIDEAMELRMGGQPQAAFDLLRDAARENSEDPDLVSAFWELACELKRSDDALSLMLGLVKRNIARGETNLAVQQWEEIAERAPAAQADRELLLRLVPVLLQMEKRKRAVQALRRALDPRLGELRAAVAVRVLELANDVDPPAALVAARRVLEVGTLHDAKRERMEALAAELEERCAALPPWDPSAIAGADSDGERSIPLESDAAYDVALPSKSEAPPAELHARELDASGVLVASDSAGELIPDSMSPGQLAGEALLPVAAQASGAGASAMLPPPPPSGAQLSESDSPFEEPPPPPPPPEGRARDLALASSASVMRFCGLKSIDAVPLELAADGVVLQRVGGSSGRVDYRRVQALAAAAVKGLAPKSVLIIDLILNWNDTGEGLLELIRVRSDTFDVRKLMPHATRSIDAFRALQEQLLARTGAVPLPDRDAVRGRPYRTYSDLESYQREVLQVEG